MKLRNKKTGRTIEYCIDLKQWSDDDSEWYSYGNYDSIDELREEWEDCTPKEPLIKDEKIRNAVRAWAEVNNLCRVTVHTTYDRYWYLRAFNNEEQSVDLDISGNCPKELSECSSYTIEELCGSEE